MRRRHSIVALVVLLAAGALASIAATSGSSSDPTEGQTLCLNPGTWQNYPHKPPRNVTPPTITTC